jgi:hypothetical protein
MDQHPDDGSPPSEDREARRRLDRAPGERFARPAKEPASDGEAGFAAGSMARAAAWAAPAAVISLVVYVAFSGPLAFSAGLVIIGIFAGRVIGVSAKAGGGGAITSDQAVSVALVVTLGWFVMSQLATWIYARNEGGVLGPIDYLLQTFGPVVPLVAIASVLAAWWSAR